MYRRNEYGEFVSPTVTKTFVSFIGLSLLQQEEEKVLTPPRPVAACAN